MRALAALAIAAAIGLLAMSTAAAVEPSGSKPLLTLALRDPVTIRGAGFRPGERIRVTLLQPTGVRVVRVGSRGGFIVSFGATMPRCELVRVIAVGGGLRAALKILPSPACLPDGAASGAASGSTASGRSAA
jgi:hypothetical protein